MKYFNEQHKNVQGQRAGSVWAPGNDRGWEGGGGRPEHKVIDINKY